MDSTVSTHGETSGAAAPGGTGEVRQAVTAGQGAALPGAPRMPGQSGQLGQSGPTGLAAEPLATESRQGGQVTPLRVQPPGEPQPAGKPVGQDTATYDPSTRALFWRALEGLFRVVNRFVPWHELPPFIGVLNLAAYRNQLRRENLHDTSRHGPDATANLPPFQPRVIGQRTSDGTYNDLYHPEMGATGYRFGRNVPLQYAFPDPQPALLRPSPREVSRQLLKRDTFIPATTLNLLAAAWIQFQTHDWFAHKVADPGNEFELPLQPGDDWRDNPMRIRRTPADPTRTAADAGLPPTYINRDSHWWDASQIYGSDPETTALLRSSKDGKLQVDEATQFLPVDPKTGLPITGFHDNWWVGLHLLHTLFAREHNAICDRLRLDHPYWSDEQLFETARLVNTALMAKIHTVDWTPAILAHPSLKIGMNANWWGLQTETIYKVFGRLTKDEAISGIPGTPTNHHGAPYALTEEFVSVYRLHPLIPEEIAFASVSTGEAIKRLRMPDVAFEKSQRVFDGDTSMADVFYSFGIAHPGAITLHNYPSFLRDLTLPDGQHLDLASVDIMRDRERGVPRYNQFRTLLHRGPVTSFDQITDNKQWAKELRDLYEGDVNRVDLMVGMFSEPLPKGFGFSDTAFRIFILMASRRLKSDRFFTVDYTPEVYTPAGLAWIDANNMTTVLLRHFPQLAPALRHVENAFAPWRRVGQV